MGRHLWNNMVDVCFFGVCRKHPDCFGKRYYCPEAREAFCELCHPNRLGVRIYRHMYGDVVNVLDDPELSDIQTYSTNDRKIVHLRPFKRLDSVADQRCVCGRGVNPAWTYCSVRCKAVAEWSCAAPRRKSTPLRSPSE